MPGRSAPTMRIGQLAAKLGVSAGLLRAWERRYDLLRPQRTPSGYRLYGAEDERRVRAMLALTGEGISTQQAAEIVLTAPAAGAILDRIPSEQLALLRDALEGFDESGANAVLDGLLARYTLRTVLTAAVLPYLADLGERWEAGSASVAQEHFASGVIRSRLLGLARGWGAGLGPRAVLACPAGERHDIGLLAFGIGLRDRGWKITWMGADTPADSVHEAVLTLRPTATVLALTVECRPEQVAGLPGPVALGGRGATEHLAAAAGAALLGGDPLAAADRIAEGVE